MEKNRHQGATSGFSDIVVLREGGLVVNGRRAKPLWLSELEFPFPGNGILSFEARGISDIGVFFSSTPQEVHEDDQVLTVESSQRADYEVVIGSYCNKKSVIRKRGVLRAFSTIGVGSSMEQPSTGSDAWQSFEKAWTFEKYWIGIKDGTIVAGKGTVGSCVFLKWEDSEPVNKSLQIGVSSWHQPVVFRFFEVIPSVEGLIVSRNESLSFIHNFFFIAREHFNRSFHDICFQSFDGSLFPCHGCVVSLWSEKLKEAVAEAIQTRTSHRRGSENMSKYQKKYGSHIGRTWNNENVAIFLMRSSSWGEQYIPSVEEIFEDIPSIRIQASTPATAMFVQMLYGIGLDRKCFYTMESQDRVLNLCGDDKEAWQECKALVKEWQISFLDFVFEEKTFSESRNSLFSRKSDFLQNLPESYSDIFVNKFVDYLNYLMDSSFLSDVELILPFQEEQNVSVNNAIFTYYEEDSRKPTVSFRAHRLVLASKSIYFLKMFSSGMKEMLQQKIQISNVSIAAFQRMLNEIYEKPVYVLNELDEGAYLWFDYLNDVKVGDMFDVIHFKREACNNLKNLLSISNVVHLANLSLECKLFDLFQATTNFICLHFEAVSQGSEFSCLREDCFLHILSRIDLEVQHENEVAIAALKWLDDNNPSVSVTQELLSMIRQKLVDPPLLNSIRERYPIYENLERAENCLRRASSTLEITVDNNERDSSLTSGFVETFSDGNDISEVFEQPRSLIFESFQFVKVEPTKWMPLQFTFQTHQEKWLLLKQEWSKMYGLIPRIAPGETWIPYIPKLHSAGVLYYLGCLYGLQLAGTRVNPHKYNIVKITSSSGSRFAKLETLAEIWISRSCFALPDAGLLVWFSVDLGHEKLLACSFYTLAHDGSESNFLRNWCFEGSKNGTDWVLLREHRNDTTLQFPMQRVTWRIEEPASHDFYRYFRVVAGPPCKKMNLGSLEIYGRLRMKWKT